MFTEQDFENLVSRLQEAYGDFITDSSSLSLLLRNCKKVSLSSRLTMGLLKGGKTYLFMWPSYGERIIDEKGFVNVDNVNTWRLCHVEGFRFMSDEYEEYGGTRPSVINRALEAYGDEVILDLEEKFNLSIRRESYISASNLGLILNLGTGWGIGRDYESCPLAVSIQEITPYVTMDFTSKLIHYDQDFHAVLHNYSGEDYEWNAWSGPGFLAFELPTHISIPISFNFPQGGI